MSNAVPDGWVEKTVAEVAHNFDGKRVPLKSVDRAERQGQYRYYGASGVIDYVDDYIFEGEYILLGEDGENVLSRNLPLAFIVSGRFWVNNHAHVLQPKAGVDIGYLCEFLESIDYKNIASGSAQPKITQGALNQIKIVLPPLPEQQKIADVLSSVDDVIEKTQAQIDKLKDLKTGMMQELMTKGISHTEFKNSPVGRIPVGWDVLTVKDLVEVMESGWSPQCEPDKAGAGEWGVLKTTSVTWDGFDYQANKKLPDNLEPRPAIQVNEGDILITRAGPAERVGVVAYVDDVPERIMLSDKIIRLVVNANYDSQFISFWLSSEYVKNYFLLRTTGLAQSQTNISQEILKGVPCVVPSLDEQKKISRTICGIENRLKVVAARLERYYSIKKALMQDLLTGKVRVKVDK